MKLRELDYVVAARVAGRRNVTILFKHILPNGMIPVITFFPFSLVGAIGSLAALDYLGFGLPPPTPSWGGMLADGRDYIPAGIWWPATFPGLAIFFTVLAINLVGDWLRDLLDPRMKK